MRYWISPKIKWSIFKELNKPFRGSIVPVNGDKTLQQMLRDRQINMFIDTKRKEDPMCITTKAIPNNCKMIKNKY